MLSIMYLILIFACFLLCFKFIKDSNFEKLFKAGKTRTILVCSIFTSLAFGFLSATAIYKIVELIIIIIK